jgi:hypothetical protein
VFVLLYTVAVGPSLHRGTSTGLHDNSRSTLLADQGLSRRPWTVHNVAMSFGPVEIFLILVGVGLVAYVLWRLVIRPRRIRPPRR